jgi:hypothetical protein
MKKYITAILSIGTISLLFYTLFDLKNQVKQIPVLQHQLDSVTIQLDSLSLINFQNEVQNGRYEITLEQLKETNPKAAKEFEEFMNSKTE